MMNTDLIEQLWDEALTISGNGLTHKEAFAQLIAKHCAKLCDERVHADKAAEAIRKEFGIEP